MGKDKRLLQGIVTGILVLLCLLFFQFFSPDNLFQKEQVIDGLFSFDRFSEYLVKPAWLSCFLGDLLPSLFIPWGGGAIMITLVLFTQWICFVQVLKQFNVGEMKYLYALFPTVLEWGSYCNSLYHLSPIFALTIALVLFLVYTRLKNKWAAMSIGLFGLFLVYDMSGIRLFVYIILVLLYEAETGQQRWGYWALLFILSFAFPILLRGYYAISEEQAFQYPHTWLPGFFPAVLFCFEVLLARFNMLKKMRVSVLSVSVTSGLILVLLIISVLGYSGC